MNISLRQLRAFATVVEHRSFTKAAEKLFVTQAGVSAMMKDLEQQLNCTLFVRTTRSVTPTAAGLRLLPAATRALRELEQASWEIDARNTQGESLLRIGVTPLVASTFAPRVVRNYMQSRPGSRVEVVDADRNEVQAMVESGELDAGFGIFFTKVSGLTRQAIFPTPLMAVAPCHGAAPPRRWAELAGLPLVVLPDDNPIQKLVNQHLPKSDGAKSERIAVRHLETAISFVEQGFGVSVMPSFARPACSRYQVKCSMLKSPEVLLDYYCITRSGSERPQAIDELVKEFSRTAKQWMAGGNGAPAMRTEAAPRRLGRALP